MAKSSSPAYEAPLDVKPKLTGPPQAYTDIDTLRSADGIIAIISQRRATGVLTFGIFKEFDRDGQTERTAFVPENLAISYQEMVEKVIERIAEIKRGAPRACAARR